ncbi:MAG: hypothetical protein ACRD2R_00125, partial [Terriglobales bacterium]
MPFTLPTGAAAEMKKRAGWAPVVLVDLELVNGTRLYWSDFAGSYPKKLGGPGNAAYSAWLKNAGPFRLSRSLRTDAGDLVVQNLSGNTIDRDVLKLVKDNEFEGALVVVRFWHELLAASLMEFHGSLTEVSGDEQEVRGRILQLLDTSQMDLPQDEFSEQCTWRYKSAQCGSAGSAVSCPKDFASCQDATRAAVERFNGILGPPSSFVTGVGG